MMRAHGSDIHAYCVRVLRNPTLAGDVSQQVFEQAFRDIDSVRDASNERAWLFGVAHHRCLDALKSQRRALRRIVDETVIEERESDTAEPSSRAEQAELALVLDECLTRLSAEVRAALLLRFHEGMTYEAMAAVCQEKPATLQARVARAMPLLRRCLRAKGLEP
jgi:RNA polymerase sigma-70 factor (ECF subfamily)